MDPPDEDFRWLSSAIDEEDMIICRVRDCLLDKARTLVKSDGRTLATKDDIRMAWDSIKTEIGKSTGELKAISKKVVINDCYGGFSLSRTAFLKLREMGNETAKEEPDCGEYWDDGSGPRDSIINSFCSGIKRDDPQLVKVIEELGKAANGSNAELKIVEIPDNVKWYIDEYDGMEHVAEEHQTWG